MHSHHIAIGSCDAAWEVFSTGIGIREQRNEIHDASVQAPYESKDFFKIAVLLFPRSDKVRKKSRNSHQEAYHDCRNAALCRRPTAQAICGDTSILILESEVALEHLFTRHSSK